MFSRVRIAIRFFFVGLAVGMLLAPRSGEETRRLVREKADRLLNDVLDAATLGTYESGTTDAAPTAPTRAGNGGRTRAKSPAATEAGV
jgi:gas vesicle protein